MKNALAYMRMTAQPHSDTAFERIVNTPTRGIGDKTIEAIRERARRTGVSLWQAAKEGVADGSYGRTGHAILGFITLIEQISIAVEGLPLHELAQHCIEVSGSTHAGEASEGLRERKPRRTDCGMSAVQRRSGAAFSTTPEWCDVRYRSSTSFSISRARER